MSTRFRIHKADEDWKPWELDYPSGFDELSDGSMHDTFDEAVAAFIKAADSRCPGCDRGAVVDTDYGWKCENCGQYDVAVGMTAPDDGGVR